MLTPFVQFDQFATYAIITLPHPPLIVAFFQFFSFIGSYGVGFIILFLAIVLHEDRFHRLSLILLITTLATTYIASDVVIKNVVKRPRPLANNQYSIINNQRSLITDNRQLITEYPSDYSFPSTHAALAFAAAAILTFFDKKRWRAFYSLAILVVLSRVYLGYHFWADILSGAVLGFVISHLMLLFLRPVSLHAKQPAS